jgi:hypothetical protein
MTILRVQSRVALLCIALASCGAPREQHRPPSLDDWTAFHECVNRRVNHYLANEPDRNDLNIAALSVGQCYGPIQSKTIMSMPLGAGGEEATRRQEILRLETAFEVRAKRDRLKGK